MSVAKKTTFDYALESIFKPNTQAKDFKSLYQLKIDTLKNFDEKVISFFKEIKIEKIKDLVECKDDLEKKMSDKKFDKVIIDAVLIATKILKKLVDQKPKEKAEKTAKIAVMGMQNAGKTSFINYLIGQSPDEKFKETSPTVSVDHRNMKLQNLQLAVWDFGGQASFRKEYLENPDDFFVNTEVLLYIVDTQDDTMYADSIDYFNSILTIMAKMKENVHMIVDFHKYDPDMSQNIDFIVKTQWLEEKFKDILKKFNFPYEIIKTSIFNDITNPAEPEIAKNLKDIFISKSADKTKTSEGDLLKNIMFIQTKIYINLMNNFMDISNALGRLEARFAATPPPPPTIQMQPNLQQSIQPSPPPKFPGFSAQSMDGASIAIVDELKELFKRKRMNVPGKP